MSPSDGSPVRFPPTQRGNPQDSHAPGNELPQVPIEALPQEDFPGASEEQDISFEEDGDTPTEISELEEPSLENVENPGLETQLAPLNGVSDSMGTIALDRTPFREKQAPATAPLATNDWSQLSDAEIMQRAGLGDDACLEYLIAKYRRPIVFFMFRMVRNQAVAEELAQEVFLRIYRSRQTYRAEARFSTWLYRIASNLAVNHARNTKHERAASNIYLDAIDEETGTSPDVADSRPSTEQEMLKKERMRQIRAQVMALPERQRMAVLMHKYQELNYKDIGAALKLSESATKSLLFRAYQTLRENLKEFV